MQFRFQILGSSSSGNCALLQTPETRILIDAGFSGRRIEAMLKQIHVPIETIDAVFLTHEHSDHSAGIRGLSKHSHIKFFANRDTAHALQGKSTKPIHWHLFENGSEFEFNGIKVHPFSIPHDAYDPIGYVFDYQSKTCDTRKRVGWATDLGYLPQLVQERIRQVEILVIESNYDTELLDNDPKRPWSLKQRVKGRHGHLSNEAAFEFLSTSQNTPWEHIFLAHISKDCNCTKRVHQLFSPLMQDNSSFQIHIVDPESGLAPALEFHNTA